ncbi:MAG: DUF5666 domain-containing protein [Armatimonadota bacterium]
MAPMSAWAGPAPGSLTEGVIASVDGSSFSVSTSTGSPIRITVTADTRIIQRQPARLEQIKPNDLVGVTAKREPDGSLVAISINILPPEFKGLARQSQFLMESGNTMTNATVFQNVRRVEGRTLYLKFPDGTAVIAVPKDAEVTRLTLLKVSDLRPGMRVMVRGGGNPDGSITAAFVTVEGAAR